MPSKPVWLEKARTITANSGLPFLTQVNDALIFRRAFQCDGFPAVRNKWFLKWPYKCCKVSIRFRAVSILFNITGKFGLSNTMIATSVLETYVFYSPFFTIHVHSVQN